MLINFGALLCRNYGIKVTNFTDSWRDGIAFNTLIHHLRPELIDLSKLPRNTNRVNLENAFATAEKHMGVPRLLDPEGL